MNPRRDRRLKGLLITVSAVGILGGIITLIPDPQPQTVTSTQVAPLADAKTPSQRHATEARKREIAARFQQAIAMLHGNQFDYAVKALHRVLELSPKLVEAHVNMGYALLGLEDYKAALDFFHSATALKPEQVNAYYGMAVALEGMGDIEGALGAMRTYIHLSSNDDPFITKARAALWEWQELLEKQRATSPQANSLTIPKENG